VGTADALFWVRVIVRRRPVRVLVTQTAEISSNFTLRALADRGGVESFGQFRGRSFPFASFFIDEKLFCGLVTQNSSSGSTTALVLGPHQGG
jgi:hypothetical protein